MEVIEMSSRKQTQDVIVNAGDVNLEGNLTIPDSAKALVVFVHGSGSSRFSPRNQYVAKTLNQAGLATLLFDLLTEDENQIDQFTRELRFNIEMLSERTIAAIDWIAEQSELRGLPIGLFGASTGAAAALNAASERPKQVATVVSRGGRPDLALQNIAKVKAPTLLLVGGLDFQVIEMNRTAANAMNAECKIAIIEGATHLFEEPGTLEQVAQIAQQWIIKHL